MALFAFSHIRHQLKKLIFCYGNNSVCAKLMPYVNSQVNRVEEKRKRGRPKGSTQYPGERKKNGGPRMTPTAQAFIKANKQLIEDMARKPHHVQWKMF